MAVPIVAVVVVIAWRSSYGRSPVSPWGSSGKSRKRPSPNAELGRSLSEARDAVLGGLDEQGRKRTRARSGDPEDQGSDRLRRVHGGRAVADRTRADAVISRVEPLERVESAFAALDSGAALKVLIDCRDAG